MPFETIYSSMRYRKFGLNKNVRYKTNLSMIKWMNEKWKKNHKNNFNQWKVLHNTIDNMDIDTPMEWLTKLSERRN